MVDLIQREELFAICSIYPDCVKKILGLDLPDLPLPFDSISNLDKASYPINFTVEINSEYVKNIYKSKKKITRSVFINIWCPADYPDTSLKFVITKSKNVDKIELEKMDKILFQLTESMLGRVCIKDFIDLCHDYLNSLCLTEKANKETLNSRNKERNEEKYFKIESENIVNAVKWRISIADAEMKSRMEEQERLAESYFNSTRKEVHSKKLDKDDNGSSLRRDASNETNEQRANSSCFLAHHCKAFLIDACYFDTLGRFCKRLSRFEDDAQAMNIGHFQRSCCTNGPHVAKIVYPSGSILSAGTASIYPIRASFDGIDLQTGLSVQIDEWCFYYPESATQSHDFATNLLARLNHLCRLPKHQNLSNIIAVDCTRHLPASGYIVGPEAQNSWKDWEVFRLICEKPQGRPLSDLLIANRMSGRTSKRNYSISLKQQIAQVVTTVVTNERLAWLRQIIQQLTSALFWLHNHSMTHRDLSLDNIFVDNSNGVTLCKYEYYSRLDDMVADNLVSLGLQNAKKLNDKCPRRSAQQRDFYQFGFTLIRLLLDGQLTDELENTAEPVITHILDQLANIQPVFKDFLQICLSSHSTLIKKLSSHAFLNDSFTYISALDPIKCQTTVKTPQAVANQIADLMGMQNVSNDLDSKKIPRLFEDFADFRLIGEGGFGSVIKARNIIEDRDYAIKCVKVNKNQSDQLFCEIRTLSSLQHENIVRYFTSWQDTFHKPLPRPEWIPFNGQSSTNHSFIDDMGCDVSMSHNDYAPDRMTDSDESSTALCEDYSSSSLSSSMPSESDLSDLLDENEQSPLSTGDQTKKKLKNEFNYIIIQMELCPSKSLRHVIDSESLHCCPDRAWSFFREITDALAYIHSKGVIHRDLKPENIMLDFNDHVKIVDFGLATRRTALLMSIKQAALDLKKRTKALESKSTSQPNNAWHRLELNANSTDTNGKNSNFECIGSYNRSMTLNVGTFLYTSPEMLTGRNKRRVYDERVDIYSLGVILFEMFYRPMDTVMERVLVLTELRKDKIVFPSDWSANEMTNQTWLIRNMLQHDPSRRSTSSDLLTSPRVPPFKATEATFRKQLLDICKHPDSNLYRFVSHTLFSQVCSRSTDLLYEFNTIHFPNIMNNDNSVKDVYLTPNNSFRKNALDSIPSGLWNYHKIYQYIVRLIESVFMAHNGVLLESPTLVPVTNLNVHSFDQLTGTVSSNKSMCKSKHANDHQTNPDISEAHKQFFGPVLLDEHGLPVCLPKSLHISFARYLTRLGSSLLTKPLFGASCGPSDTEPTLLDQCRVIKRFQFGKVYRNSAHQSTFGNATVNEWSQSGGSPIETPHAVFDIVSKDFNVYWIVELFSIFHEITSKMIHSKDTLFFLYVNHTNLVKALFKVTGIEHESRVPIWYHLDQANANARPVNSRTYSSYFSADAGSNLSFGSEQPTRTLILPDFLTANAKGHAQKRFLKIVRFETSRLDHLRQLFVCNSTAQLRPIVSRLLDQAIKQLHDMHDWFAKMDWSSRFHLRFAPGLVLPHNLYDGLIFQLVAVYNPPSNGCVIPTSHSSLTALDLDDSGPTKCSNRPSLFVIGNGGDFTNFVVRTCVPKNLTNVCLPKKSYRTGIVNMANVVLDGMSYLAASSCPNMIAGLTIDLQALLCCFVVQMDMDKMKWPTFATPTIMDFSHFKTNHQILVGWQTRFASSIQELSARSSIHLNKYRSRSKSGTFDGFVHHVDQATSPAATATQLQQSSFGAGDAVNVFVHQSHQQNAAFVSNHDAVQLAAHMVQRFWDFGLPCELMTDSHLDVVREAENRQCDYAIRVVLTVLSPKAVQNMLPSFSAKCLPVITYQIWTRHDSISTNLGGAGAGATAAAGRQHVMVAETTCSDPNTVINYFANCLSPWRCVFLSLWSSGLCASRYSFNDAGNDSASLSPSFCQSQPHLVHYSKDYLSQPNPDAAIIYQPRLLLFSDTWVSCLAMNDGDVKPVFITGNQVSKDASSNPNAINLLKVRNLTNRLKYQPKRLK